MAEKDGQARDPKTGKFLGKYDTMEDAEKGYTELEKKLGEQGKSLGDTKKQYEDYAKKYQEILEWAQKAAPIVEWYGKYNQPIQQWWHGYQGAQPQQFGGNGQMTQQQPNSQAMQQQAYQQAQYAVANTQGVELLTQQEKDALINQTAQRIFQSALAPWTQQFARTVEDWGQKQAQQISSQLDQRHKAFSDVLWKTLERVLPPEKLQETRAWHDEALKYADPKNIDPLSLAGETLSLRSDKSRLEKELSELRADRERREKESLGSIGNNGGLFSRPTDQPKPTEKREDRFKNVMSTVKEAVGTEGLREQFPRI